MDQICVHPSDGAGEANQMEVRSQDRKRLQNWKVISMSKYTVKLY